MDDLSGSSPRMRGTRSIRNSRTIHPGIIPAHAGNTGALRRSVSHGRDHPRACGEHLISLWRVRHGGGIIPAHAGNTPYPRPPVIRSRDHPRACGEHVRRPPPGCTPPGSSPRMRGTRRPLILSFSRTGIIPAHAGNTRRSIRLRPGHGDHPRACGEHAKKLARYQGIRLRISVFSFSFTLSTSSPFDICWHYSNHAEEYQRMMLPSFL